MYLIETLKLIAVSETMIWFYILLGCFALDAAHSYLEG